MSQHQNQPAETGLVPVSSGGQLQTSKDLLNYYMTQVRKYPILDKEEEYEYAVRYRETEDPEAAEKLVTSNLRLVIKIAFQYHRQWANVLDLIQEGNVGLVEALSRYDPYREIRFSGYAQYWVRAMILRFLLDNFRMVRLGSTRAGRKLFFQLQKERDLLIKAGISPSTKLLAERLGVKEEDVADVDQHMRAPALSYDGPASDNDSSKTLSEIISKESQIDPEQASGDMELGGIIQQHLKIFRSRLTDEREIRIWDERMIATDPVSLSTLGDVYKVTKERIRQVEARIKKRLKSYLIKELGDEIDFEFQIPEER